MDEPGKHLGERESEVEPTGELGEVSRQVPGADVVVAAMQRALDVAQDGIYPGQCRMLRAVRCACGHERLVKTPGALHRREAAQGIAEHEGARFEVALEGASTRCARTWGTRTRSASANETAPQRTAPRCHTRPRTASGRSLSETESNSVPFPSPDLSTTWNYTGRTGSLDELGT